MSNSDPEICPCCGQAIRLQDTPPKLKKALGDDFEAFWSRYPKKTAKPYCKEIWKRKGLSLELVLPALKMSIASRDWQKDGGQFIPNPSTWLNQGRWEDEGLDYAALKVERPVLLKPERKVDHNHYMAWKTKEGYPPCILTTQFREDPTYIQQAYLKNL